MSRYDALDRVPIREAVSQLNVDELKPLVNLIAARAEGRKADLVEAVAKTMENPTRVRALYDGLDAVGKRAVEEAAHDPGGLLNLKRFRAKYGDSPGFGGDGRARNQSRPTTLRLFFPRYLVLPADVQETLSAFVPEPPPLTVHAIDDLPSQVRRPQSDWGSSYWKPNAEELEPSVRETARAALHDVRAVLRLIDAGGVRVGETTRRPSQAAMTAVRGVLADGDFYDQSQQSKETWDPACDLNMKAFAWPLLVQAAGLAQLSGAKLQLSAAGRKAATKPAHEVIRLIWEKWLKTTLLDEFNRIDGVKGQQSRGSLTAVAPRRQAAVEMLANCPPKKWISIEEVFRVTNALADDFHVSRAPWKIYIGEQRYGNFGYDGHYTWELIEGRYVLAVLFEYAATLGLVDVACIAPQHARNDFHERWGADELSCLSRYDGLLFVRMNSLGAWCLGLSEQYELEMSAVRPVLKVLANLDVVVTHPPLSPADALFLDRFAERSSEAVWQLGAAKIMRAVEEGQTLAELRDFLKAKSEEPLPQNVEVFLADLEQKAGQLEDLGAARLIACADAHLAQLLANDRRLRNLCQLAGNRHLVFRAADEPAFRRMLRELGYVLPPSK